MIELTPPKHEIRRIPGAGLELRSAGGFQARVYPIGAVWRTDIAGERNPRPFGSARAAFEAAAAELARLDGERAAASKLVGDDFPPGDWAARAGFELARLADDIAAI